MISNCPRWTNHTDCGQHRAAGPQRSRVDTAEARDQKAQENTPLVTLLRNALRGSGRKLHVGLDPNSGQIVTPTLTTEHVDDETALPDLCATDQQVNRVLGAGAYDGSPHEAVIRGAYGVAVEIVIRPPSDAILGNSIMRNAHIAYIESTYAWPGRRTPTAMDDLALRLRLGATNQ